MAYCTVSDVLQFIPTLRLGGASEATSAHIQHLIDASAVELDSAIARLGYDTTSPDTCQSRLLRLINCVMAVQPLIISRGSEVDLAYIALLRRQTKLFDMPLQLLRHNVMDVAFLGIDYTLPLDTTIPSYHAVAFAGTGSNTITVTNHYSGTATALYEVQILSPTTFQWRRDGGAYSAPVTITGTAQLLNDGVYITLPLSGHVAGDTWTITVVVTVTFADVQGMFPILFDDIGITTATIDYYIDLVTALIKTIAANRGYVLGNLDPAEAQSMGRCTKSVVAAIVAILIDLVTRQGRISDTTDTVVSIALATIDDLRHGRYDDIHRTIL